MKHPIYKNKDAIMFANNIDNPLLKQAVISGLNNFGDVSTIAFLVYSMIVNESIIKNGHVYININGDDWYSEISAKTLDSIKLSEFKLPFKAGYLDLGDGDYISYSKFEDGRLASKINSLGIDVLTHNEEDPMLEEDIIMLVTKTMHVPLLTNLTIAENIEMMSSVSGDLEKDYLKSIYEKINIFISIMLYVSTYKNDKDRVVSSLAKGIKSASKGIKKHTVNVVKLYQHTKNENLSTESSSWQSDKRWIVRGHWRNQFYKTTNEYKPKWIDPYWKGVGKEIEKVYKIK